MNASSEDPPQPRIGLRQLGQLTAYWFGLWVAWGGLTTIVLPRLVEQAAPVAIKTTAIAFIAGLQALVAIIVQPLSGATSDRLVTPWGRRRPLMVAGVGFQVGFVLMLAVVQAYWAILVVMILVEIASNTAQGPYQGLLPDLIPPGERGLGSGLLGAGNLAGQVLGVTLCGIAIEAGAIPVAVAICCVALVGGTFVTAVSVNETQGRSAGGERPPVDWARELLRPARWAAPVRRMVLEVWGRDVLEHRDYLWLLASRLAILMAAGTLQTFAYYYLEDALKLGGDAGPAVAPLAGTVALVALVSAIPGGALTARWGRVRTVAFSAICGAIGSILFSVATSYVLLFAIAIPFGLAIGIFLSADWALLTDIAPLGQAGRYLGLSNTATAGATLLSVAIGGPVADLVNGYQFGLGYRAVFILAAVEFVIGAWCVGHVAEPAREVLPGEPAPEPVEAGDA